MKNIDHDNIEKWIFNYTEGNLNSEEKRALHDFMEQFPFYREDLSFWEDSYYEDEEMEYPMVTSLYSSSKRGVWAGWAAASVLLLVAGGAIGWFLRGATEVDASSLYAQRSNVDNIHVGNYSAATFEFTNENTDEANLLAENHVEGNYQNETNNVNSSFVNSPNSIGSNNNGANHMIPSNSDNIGTTNELTDRGVDKNDGAEVNLVAGLTEKKQKMNLLDDKSVDNSDLSEDNEVKSTKNEAEIEVNSDKVEELKDSERINKLLEIANRKVGFINLTDPYFIKPEAGLLMQNPSYTGTDWNGRMEFVSRLDRNDMATHNYIAYDSYSTHLKGGYGFYLDGYYSSDGGLMDGELGFIYSPDINVANNKLKVKPSVKVGVGHREANRVYSKEIEYSMMYGITNTINPDQYAKSMSYVDGGFGLLVLAKKFQLGASMDNVRQPIEFSMNNEGYTVNTPISYKVHASTDYQKRVRSMLSFSPFVLFEKSGEYENVWAGSMLKYNFLRAGASVSMNKDVRASVGLNIGKVNILYSIDKNMTYNFSNSKVFHEVGVRMNFNQLVKKPGMNYLNKKI